MSLTADAHGKRLPWNRNDRIGYATNIFGALALAVLVNAIVAGADLDFYPPAALVAAPPAWLVGLVWLLVFPLWGAARWRVWHTGLSGIRRSRWISVLMGWSLLQPFVAGGLGVGGAAAASALALGLNLIAAHQARAVTKRGFWLLTPSILWLGYLTLLYLAALAET